MGDFVILLSTGLTSLAWSLGLMPSAFYDEHPGLNEGHKMLLRLLAAIVGSRLGIVLTDLLKKPISNLWMLGFFIVCGILCAIAPESSLSKILIYFCFEIMFGLTVIIAYYNGLQGTVNILKPLLVPLCYVAGSGFVVFLCVQLKYIEKSKGE